MNLFASLNQKYIIFTSAYINIMISRYHHINFVKVFNNQIVPQSSCSRE